MVLAFNGEYDSNELGVREQDEEGSQPEGSADVNSYGFTINKAGSLITNLGALTAVTGMTGDPVFDCSYATGSNPDDWHRFVVTDDGTDVRIYRWYANGKLTLSHTASGGAGYQISAAQLESLLVFASPGFAPIKYNGSTFAALSGIPCTYSAETTTEVTNASDIPAGTRFAYIVKHRQRLWGLDNDKRNVWHYTPMYAPEGWGNSGTGAATKGGWISMEPKDGGGECVSAASFEGTSGEVLVINKQTNQYALYGNHSRAISGLEPFTLKQISAVGSNSPQSIIRQGKDIAFLDSEKKLRSLKTTIENAELQPLILSYDIQNTYLDLIRTKALPYVWLEDDVERNQLWLSCRKSYVDTEIPIANTSIRALYHMDSGNAAVAATGTILFSVNPTAADTITINSVVFTFIAGASTATDIHIGANLAATMAEAKAVLNASVNGSVDDATYGENSSNTITITHDTPGTGGNSFTLAASVATVSGATLTGGLAASTTITDSTKNGLDLTATATPTLFKGFNRLHRDAYHLNGSTQYLRRTATAGTNASTAYTALSVRIWGLIDVLPGSGDRDYLYSEASASGTFSISIKNTAGVYTIIGSITDNAAAVQEAIYTFTPVVDTWYEWVMTWDGTTITLYQDSASVATKAWAGTIQSNQTDGFSVGAIASGASGYFDGKVDECMVMNDDLTFAQISTFYTEVSRKNDLILKYDYKRKAWQPEKSIYAPSIIFQNRQLFTTTYDGKVFLENYSTTRPDTVSSRRQANYRWPWDDLRKFGKQYKNKRKQITVARLFLADISNDGDIEFNLYYDDQTVNRIQKRITQTSTGVWGENWGDTAGTGVMIWTANSLNGQEVFSADWEGSGKMFQFEVYKWDDDFNFRIVKLQFEGVILGDY